MIIYSIYTIVNQINGKVYVGYTSKPFNKRLNEHKSRINKKTTKLYNAIKKYGWDNFTKQIIYQTKDFQHCLKIMEPFFIREYNSLKEGYNLTEGGEGSIGFSPSEETRFKMSISRKGKTSHRKGKKLSREVCDKMSESHIGIKLSTDHKNNIALGVKNQKRVFCPHCNTFGAIGNMKRYYFDFCKNRQ